MKFVVAAIVAICMASSLVAQGVRLVGETQRTRERLDEGAELERQQKTETALEHYLKILTDVPDHWVPVLDGRVLRPCRQVVLNRIAANPQLRNAYRDRFEGSADSTARQAIGRKAVGDLERLVATHWPTKTAAKTLDTLGDLAFERGDLSEAVHWWRLLAGPPRNGEAVVPDPPMDVAQVRAKSILATGMLGESTEMATDDFRREFPAASGRLMGRDGVLTDILKSVSQDASTNLNRIEPSMNQTFGANSNRIGATALRLPQLAPRRLEPVINWPSGELQPAVTLPERDPIASPRRLTTHPLTWAGKLIASDGDRVFAFHLENGAIADVFGPPGRQSELPPEPQSLTVDGNRVFARLNRTTIVGLVRDPAANDWAWKKVMEIRAASLGENVNFEGCPIVSRGRIYLSWISSAVNRVNVTLGCFSADDPSEGPIWATSVAEIALDPDVHRARLPLLTLIGPNIVYGTDAGAVIALNAATGKPAWVARYPSRGPRGLPTNLLPVPRDLCPPVYADGRVFVAPTDSDEILALDAWSGVPLWDRPPILEVVQMLGVIDGKLIITADGIFHGIGAIDTATGKIDRQWGDLRAAAPFGRGLILGGVVLFPSRNNGLLVLDRSGKPVYGPTLFRDLPGGNLACGNGTLAIAMADHILRLSFDPPEHKGQDARLRR
jgi:outer membrane protein assembly factor BamB